MNTNAGQNGQHDSNGQTRDQQEDPRQAAASHLIVDEHGDPYVKTANVGASKSQTVKKLLKALRSARNLNILLTAIIAASAIFQAAITSCNNQSATRQTESLIADANINASAAQKIAAASERNATAAEGFSQSASQINQGVGEAVGKLKLQVDASRTLADLTRKQFALAQRPWIQVDTAIEIYQAKVVVGRDSGGKFVAKPVEELFKSSSQKILGNVPVIFTARFKNVGHSPAIHESGYMQMGFIELPGEIKPGLKNVPIPEEHSCTNKTLRPRTTNVVFPNGPYTADTDQLPSVSDIDDWVHLKKTLVIYGCIKYADELGGLHQTDFCSNYDRLNQPIEWRPCPTGNAAW